MIIMGCRDLSRVTLYLLLLCSATVPFSYGLEFLRQAYTDAFSIPDTEEPEPVNRYIRSALPPEKYIKRDNRKPVLDCSKYNPTVNEEEPPGAFVMRVNATDEDNDHITYRFQQRADDRGKFSINETTGIITTNIRFDRDDVPSRQKEIYVTVLATDDGTPPLFDVCTFKILINDINDNAPLFDKSIYIESIPEDLEVNKEVMRIYATDSDAGNNSVVLYSLDQGNQWSQYFNIDEKTGIITLKKPIPKGMVSTVMKIRAQARDLGDPVLSSDIDLEINIADSTKKSPTFTEVPSGPIYLDENFADFDYPITNLTAQSNLENPECQFQLLTGRTDSTNRVPTFMLVTIGSNQAILKLRERLDYEAITEYTLTVTVTNADSLSAVTKISIKIRDVNDNIPTFVELASATEKSGSVSENEPKGTPVMKVQATDKDGTSPNNIVTYELADNRDLFTIDKNSGEIKTLAELDRETKSVYTIKVIARDGAPSANSKTGEHNSAEQVFRIEVDDKNDNPPKFTKSVYIVEKVDESADPNKVVIEVKAEDKDTASRIQYRIIDGNTDDAFMIENTGRIRVNINKKLDYETVNQYELKVVAEDGKYSDTATVKISIRNENDEVPIFDDFIRNITIDEETLVDGCLVTVRAHDPDKKPDEPQEIIYSIVANTQPNNSTFLSVDQEGCVKLIMKLDRDPPKGSPHWQALITATDENGSIHSNSDSVTYTVYLNDINDNAPVLNTTEVVWNERTPITEGPILQLFAEDIDEEKNGPPFAYTIPNDASKEILDKFTIIRDGLMPKVVFDREEKKEYIVPIKITDSGVPQQTGVSYLKVIIGDVNDNQMKPGSSKIFVNSRTRMPNTVIGRVYVEDLDDWDLPDKQFEWGGHKPRNFMLNQDTGEITILQETDPNVYELNFLVTERSHYFATHQVNASVTVHVKGIPDEAIIKSGSFRLTDVSPQDFITGSFNQSLKDKTQARLAKIVNVSLENLDIVSILHSDLHKDDHFLDIRYSAHGSPYHYPEELNTLVTLDQEELNFVESIYMVNIAECLSESVCPDYSCTNYLNIADRPYVVNTNKTSFVGVSAVVEPKCTCSLDNVKPYCLNDGVLNEDALCNCEPGYFGPHCEALSISFLGNGFAMYPPFETCNDSILTLEIMTKQEDGLIFYIGPLRKNHLYPVKDFMSLELRKGYPVLLIDYGNGTAQVEQDFKKLNDGTNHIISIAFNTKYVQLNVDNCGTSDCITRGYSDVPGPNKALNVNGPLQLGGFILNVQEKGGSLQQLAAEMAWNHTPTAIGFVGCISNLTYNGQTYNLGQPNYGKYFSRDCNNQGPTAAAFGIDSNFLVALLVCLAILLILLLAVVVHRRKHDHWNEKELDDIRETIINYEDEGGGEVDTGFDLELLRRENQFDEPHIKKQNDMFYRTPEEVPDINGFLKDKKDACDKDPDFNPFDDVRYYAYEGDGNTSRSSLSSLASCTDEGDLKFNYLSNFGPRFRKLADMYGEPSDEEDNDGGEESWC